MKKCKFCKKKINLVYTLKHLYYYCKNCNYYFRNKFNSGNIFNFFFKKKHYLHNNNTNKQTHFKYYKSLLEKQSYNLAFNEDKYNYMKTRNKRPSRVLDIGGSPGIDAVIMLRKKIVDTIEITEYNSDIAKNIYKKTKIKTYNFDLSRLKIINKKKYDLIILWNVIYYCDNLERLFEIIKKNLTPGGKIILCSPCPTLGLIIKYGVIESYPPKFLYPIKLIKESLNKNNLKIKKISLSKSKNFIKHNFSNFKNLYFLKKNLLLICISLYYLIRNFNNILKNGNNFLGLQNYILECEKNK